MQRSWTTVRPFMVGLGLFAALALVNQARGFELWRNYALSGVLLGSVVTWAVWHTDVRIPAFIQWTIVGGLLLHYGGGSMGSPEPGFRMGFAGFHGINGTYHVFGWWDNLTHGVGIGAASMAVAYLLELYQTRRGLRWPAPLVACIAFLSGLAAGVGVELYEYLGKSAFQTIDQGGYRNTMTDLVFNVAGAALGTGIAVALDRTRFWAHIQRNLGARPEPAGPGPTAWWRHVPPGMAGFFVFITVPAAATLLLAGQFLVKGAPVDDRVLYDPALQVLLVAAVLGIVGGLGTAMVAHEASRRAAGRRAA